MQHTRSRVLSTFFCIHKLTDNHEWLVPQWLTGMSKYTLDQTTVYQRTPCVREHTDQYPEVTIGPRTLTLCGGNGFYHLPNILLNSSTYLDSIPWFMKLPQCFVVVFNIHSSIIFGCPSWSLSQLMLDESQGKFWAGHEFIAGLKPIQTTIQNVLHLWAI